MPTESNEQLYERWLSVWSDRHASLEALIAEDAVGHWPDGDVVGPRGFARAIAQTIDMFDTVEFAVEAGPLSDGEIVAARWLVSCRTGDETMVFAGADFLRIADGKIAEYWPSIHPVGTA